MRSRDRARRPAVDERAARRDRHGLRDPAAPESTVTFCGAPTVVTRTIAFVRIDLVHLVVEVVHDPDGLGVGIHQGAAGADGDRLRQRRRPRVDPPKHSREWVGDPDGAGRDGEVVEVPAARRILRVTRFERGSIRTIAPFGWPRCGPPRSITHKAPAPAAIAVAAIPSIVATTSFVRASTREIVAFPLIAQTLPFASARCA